MIAPASPLTRPGRWTSLDAKEPCWNRISRTPLCDNKSKATIQTVPVDEAYTSASAPQSSCTLQASGHALIGIPYPVNRCLPGSYRISAEGSHDRCGHCLSRGTTSHTDLAGPTAIPDALPEGVARMEVIRP